MNQEYEIYNKLGDKIDGTKQDLLDRIVKLSEESIKKADLKSELEHYITKYKTLFLGLVLGGILCSAYLLLTPILIKSEIAKLETKIDELITITKSKQ